MNTVDYKLCTPMMFLLLQTITKSHILSLTMSFKILVLIKAWLFGKSLYIVIPIPVGGPPINTKCPSSFSMISAVSWAHFHGSWSGCEAIPVSVSGAKIVSPTPQWVYLRNCITNIIYYSTIGCWPSMLLQDILFI